MPRLHGSLGGARRYVARALPAAPRSKGKPAPRGATCYVARALPTWLPCPGRRKSHIGLFLDRHSSGAGGELKQSKVAQLLAGAVPRLRAPHVLVAATIALQRRLPGTVLSSIFTRITRKECSRAIRERPSLVLALLRALAAPTADARESGSVSVVSHVARELASHTASYGEHAIPLLQALARAGGPVTLRRLPPDSARRLVRGVCRAARLELDLGLPVGPDSASDISAKRSGAAVSSSCSGEGEGEVMGLPDLQKKASVEDMAHIYCSAHRLGYRDPELSATLSQHLADNLDELPPLAMPALVQALSRGGDAHEFVLLNAACRRSIKLIGTLSLPHVVALLSVLARYDFYEEEFLEFASARLRAEAGKLSAWSLADTLSAAGGLQFRDAGLLDALCSSMASRAADLSETDLVKAVRALVKLRQSNAEWLEALVPVIDKDKHVLSSLSLSNTINAMSHFDHVDPHFMQRLLGIATQRLSRLGSASVQHILAALCRQHGRIPEHVEPMEAICKHLTTPSLISQLTPIQAVTTLSALAKLKHRDLVVAAVLLSALAGRGADVSCSWGPSRNFWCRSRQPLQRWFDEDRCIEHLRNSLEASHLVDVLTAVHRLELYGALTLRLCWLIWHHLLAPHLHELRAREVINVARALGACQFPDSGAPGGGSLDTDSTQSAADAGEPPALQEPAAPAGQGDGPVSDAAAFEWKEHVVRSCIENLRRHEYFLESAWFALLPFKLLCLEMDQGVYGCRGLSEVLNGTLLSFAERLRDLTNEEAEANRLRREGLVEEEPEAAGPRGADAIASGGLCDASATRPQPPPPPSSCSLLSEAPPGSEAQRCLPPSTPPRPPAPAALPPSVDDGQGADDGDRCPLVSTAVDVHGLLVDLVLEGSYQYTYSTSFVVDRSGGELGQCIGNIKTFDLKKNYGFIACKQLAAAGHGDVFLHGSMRGRYKAGQTVKFTAVLNQDGKPVAVDLRSGLK